MNVLPSLPAAWQKRAVVALGGLFQVGFADGQDLLLVHAAQERRIYDTVWAERLAFDDKEPMDTFDTVRLVADGFALLSEQTVRMAGLFGGGLLRVTQDGFSLEEEAPDWPTRRVVLTSPDRSRTLVADDGACELRAFGFSQTGLSFVIATSCELLMFGRAS